MSKIDAPTLLANLLCPYRAESEMERIGHRKISLLGKMSLLILVSGAGWVAAGSAQTGDEMPGGTGDAGKSNDNELRSQATQPSEKLSALVEEYRTQDPNASFSFFNGHIDSFSTTPKETIPEYAVKTLKELGLPAQAAEPLKIQAPIFSGTLEKQSHDVEAQPDEQLPYVGEELQTPEKSKGKEKEDSRESSADEVAEENRTEAASSPHEMLDWERPTKELLAKEKRAASKILQAFLEQHGNLFEISAKELNESMKLMDFTHGAYTRKAIYKQFYSKNEAVLYGKTIVQFDINWNVVGISRMIVTPQKFPLDKLKAGIPGDKAIKIASNAKEDCASDDAKPLLVEPSIDLIRKRRVWNVELTSKRGACHWRVIVDRAEGTVLNVSDLVSQAYNDAKMNRWYFTGGDLFSPQQIVSPNQYTRNDRRLEHDFFYMMNDHRCEGSAETDCSLTPQVGDTWCENAYGTDNGSSYIRATRRLDRDFVSYFPGGESETFGETNAYYWGRWFSQWLKPSLDALGSCRVPQAIIRACSSSATPALRRIAPGTTPSFQSRPMTTRVKVATLFALPTRILQVHPIAMRAVKVTAASSIQVNCITNSTTFIYSATMLWIPTWTVVARTSCS